MMVKKLLNPDDEFLLRLRKISLIKSACIVKKNLSRTDAINLAKSLHDCGFCCFLHDFDASPLRIYIGNFGIECVCRRSLFNRRKVERRNVNRNYYDKRNKDRRKNDVLGKLIIE